MVKDVQNNKLVIYVIFEKKDANILPKPIIFSVKRFLFKNLICNIKKTYLSIC